ncbi:rCG45734 [Rattus norvegicus]|uniref:RCG45734 n=1 Tax=Rattus norvegicus TaxID=10116 RepID=A6JTN6_RAT|nr:rCG45734 [Rattus norvegicus]
MYQPLYLTRVTMFAVGKYTCFIQSFPKSAEEFFMRGYQVHYYLFTHDPAAVPRVPLGPVGSSASSPSRVPPSGRRFLCAEWRPSTNTLTRGPTSGLPLLCRCGYGLP